MSTVIAESYVEIEPTLKRQAEEILSKIGLSFSQAVNLFTRQIVLRREFPIELNVPVKKPRSLEDMTEEEFDAMIQEGFDDIEAGRVHTIDEAKKILGLYE